MKYLDRIINVVIAISVYTSLFYIQNLVVNNSNSWINIGNFRILLIILIGLILFIELIKLIRRRPKEKADVYFTKNRLYIILVITMVIINSSLIIIYVNKKSLVILSSLVPSMILLIFSVVRFNIRDGIYKDKVYYKAYIIDQTMITHYEIEKFTITLEFIKRSYFLNINKKLEIVYDKEYRELLISCFKNLLKNE